jgi:hypothetical protein
LLLEKEPKKLGEDVAIQIPPIDDSKFVSRLNADRTKDAKSDARSAASPGSADISVKPGAGAAPSPAPATPRRLRKRRNHPLHLSRYRP